MFSSTRISGSVYNTLRAIEIQPLMLVDILYDIGHLFVGHVVNKDVEIALLHRHFELDDEEVMVHVGLCCSPALPGTTNEKLKGTAFFLQDNDEFQAFEYAHAEPLNLSMTFLRALREFLLLLHHNLQHYLALSRLDQEHPKLMEHCEDDDSRTQVCEVVTEKKEIMWNEVTEWRFDATSGFVVPVIVRGCTRNREER